MCGTKKYFELFTDHESFVESWNGISNPPTDDEVLFAYYSGYAFALFVRDGKLCEVQDAHCSCNGLENWEPEETTWAALALRATTGFNFSGEAQDALRKLIEENA